MHADRIATRALLDSAAEACYEPVLLHFSGRSGSSKAHFSLELESARLSCLSKSLASCLSAFVPPPFAASSLQAGQHPLLRLSHQHRLNP